MMRRMTALWRRIRDIVCQVLAGQRLLTPTDPASSALYLGLRGHFRRVVHLNAEVPDHALQLRVPKKVLAGQLAGS